MKEVTQFVSVAVCMMLWIVFLLWLVEGITNLNWAGIMATILAGFTFYCISATVLRDCNINIFGEDNEKND